MLLDILTSFKLESADETPNPIFCSTKLLVMLIFPELLLALTILFLIKISPDKFKTDDVLKFNEEIFRDAEPMLVEVRILD